MRHSIILFLFGCLFACGCTSRQIDAIALKPGTNYFDVIPPETVGRVIIDCNAMEDIFIDGPQKKLHQNDKDGTRLAYFSITDPEVIQKLFEAGRKMNVTSRVNYPFIGVLSYQIYLTKNNEVLFMTHIVNDKATVGLFSTTITDDDGAIGTPIQTPREFSYMSGMGHNPDYVRLVYDLMMQYNPTAIHNLDRIYKDMCNRSLEQMLFEMPSDKKGE